MKRAKAVLNGKTIYNVYDSAGTLVHVDEATDGKATDYISGPTGTLARITSTVPGQTQDDVITYMHSDHLGSASAATDDNGAVIWTESYAPYGETLNSPDANHNQAGFTGHIKDKATGLNYMQARYYDPVAGRFLSVDPVTFLDTGKPTYFNRYRYCANDPINCTDPTGTSDAFGTTDSILAEVVNEVLVKPLYDFFVADGVEAGKAIANGDIKAAAIPAAKAALKPVKAADKANDLRKAGKKAKDAKKADRHGDGGRALSKADKQIQGLEKRMDGAPKKERKKLQKKIERIKETAHDKKRGTEHNKR